MKNRHYLSFPAAIVFLAQPLLGGDRNVYKVGATANASNNSNWSLGAHPFSATSAGAYKDVLFESTVTGIVASGGNNSNMHVESYSVTNGSSYTLGISSSAQASFRAGATGTTTGEVTAPFTNDVSGVAQDLVYLSGNSSLEFLGINGGAGSTPTFQLRQSGNFNILAGSTLTMNPVVSTSTLPSGGSTDLAINGGGTVIFNAANTYTGVTTINGGTLRYGIDNAIKSGAVTIAGTLDLQTFNDTVGAVTLSGGSIIGTGTLTPTSVTSSGGSISANIAGAGGIKLDGIGPLVLSGANTYGGDTNVTNGTLQAQSPAAIPPSSKLATSGSVASTGTLNLGTADPGYAMNQLKLGGIIYFTGPSVGTATLTFTGGAAVSGTTIKRINVDSAARVIVNGTNFDLIGSQGINNRDVEITVDGFMAINAVVQDNASGGSAGNVGNLIKRGIGTLSLGAANTYGGTTTTREGGVLRLDAADALPASSPLILDGGLVGLTAASGDFTRAVGTGNDEVQWKAGSTGGFAAYGGDHSVNFGGAGSGLSWLINGPFGAKGLLLGATDSDSTITIVNPINLSNAVRTVTVANGSATVDAVLAGDLTSPGASIVKAGPGTLSLTGTNTYGGGTTVSGGTLIVNGLALSDTGDLDIAGGKIEPVGSETVGALFFDGIVQTPGTWGSSASSAEPAFQDDSRFSGTGTIVSMGAPSTGYDTWADANANGQTADLDADGDGVANGVEYFMGQTGMGFTALPTLVDGKLTFPRDSSAAVSYAFQTSETLAAGSWTTITPPDAAIDETVPTQVTFSLGNDAPKKFVRLVVTPN